MDMDGAPSISMLIGKDKEKKTEIEIKPEKEELKLLESSKPEESLVKKEVVEEETPNIFPKRFRRMVTNENK